MVDAVLFQGEYVRLWVPELQEIRDGTVHHVWTLSNNVLSRAGVSLGETYPNPIVVAPEWGKHTNKKMVSVLLTCTCIYIFTCTTVQSLMISS